MAYSKTIKGLTIQIGGDTTGFSKAISDVDRQLKQATSSINQLNKDIKFDPSNVDLMADRMAEYSKAIQAAQDKVKALKAALEEGTKSGVLDDHDVQSLNEQIHRTESQIKQLTGTYDDLKANGGQSAEDLAKAQKGVTAAVKSTTDAADEAAKHLSEMYDLDSVADGLTDKITRPVTSFLTDSIDKASNFEQKLANISELDLGNTSIDKIKKQIDEVSKETGESTENLSDAVYNAISGGRSADKAVDFVKQVKKTATAGLADVTDTTKLMDTIVNSYGKSAGTYEQISDKLLTTQNLGVTTVKDLAQSLGDVIPTANSAGVSFNDLMASVATLTKGGLATNKAVTGFKSAISSIIKPTKDAKDAADALGVDFSVKHLQDVGIGKFLQETEKAMEGASPEYAKIAKQAKAYNTTLSQGTAQLDNNKKKIDSLRDANAKLSRQMSSVVDPKTGKHTTTSTAYKQLKAQYDANKDQITQLTRQDQQLSKANTQARQNLKGVQGSLETLAAAGNSKISGFAKLFTNVEGLNAVMSMTSDNGAKDFANISKQMSDSAGTLSESYNKVTNTAEHSKEKLLNDIDLLKESVGDELLPLAKDSLQVAQQVMGALDKMPTGARKAAIGIALAAATLGPVLKTVSAFKKMGNLASIAKSLKPLQDAGSAAGAGSAAASGAGQTLTSTLSTTASTGSQLASVGTNFLRMSSYVGVAAEIGLVIEEYGKVMEDISNLKIGKNWQTNMQAVAAFAAAGAGISAGLTALGTGISKAGMGKDVGAGEALTGGFEAEIGAVAVILQQYAQLIQQISNLDIADDYQDKLDLVQGMIGRAGIFVGAVTAAGAVITGLGGGGLVLAGELISAGIEGQLAAVSEIIQSYAATVQQINDMTIDADTFNANLDHVRTAMTSLNSLFAGQALVDFVTLVPQMTSTLTNLGDLAQIKLFLSTMDDLTKAKMPTQDQIDAFGASMQSIQQLFAGDGYHFGDIVKGIAGNITGLSDTIDMAEIKAQFDLMMSMIKGLQALSGTSSGKGKGNGKKSSSLATNWTGMLKYMSNDTATYMQQIINTVSSSLAKLAKMFKGTKLKLNHHIALPHFTYNKWDGNPGQPMASVSWYAKGGIFNSPSVIGVGEHGTEAVVPIDKLNTMLADNQAASTRQIVGVLSQILTAQQRPLVLDSGALVGGISGQMDNALGQRSHRARRQR